LATLDCESLETSLKSICEIYDAKPTSVIDFLSRINLDLEFQRKMIPKQPEDYLQELFESEFGSPTRSLEKAVWFHLTRVPAGTTFAEGLLPLRLALNQIWTMISSIPSNSRTRQNLEKFRESGIPSYEYGLKTSSGIHHGPHAMLVRESAFHARVMGNRDYLNLPEIVEDICNGFEREFGESIHGEVKNALKPCIVKFESSRRSGSDLLAPVLLYCSRMLRKQELSLNSNTCYDGGGVTIPPAEISRIDFI